MADQELPWGYKRGKRAYIMENEMDMKQEVKKHTGFFPDKTEMILDAGQVETMISGMAREILEHNHGRDNLALIGIMTRGDFLARRLARQIASIGGTCLPVGSMDINMYRDDWTIISEQPIVRPSHISFDIQGKHIILVDDVLFTGRTIRAALEALTDFGRPAKVSLGVLVDRGHRELPIQPDYKGIFLETDADQNVQVLLKEHDGQDLVYTESKKLRIR